MSESEEIESRHKKELKALEGEKRASLKKAKATAGKGKKGKDIISAIEAEYEVKFKEMQERHAKELESSQGEACVQTDKSTPQTPQVDDEEEARRQKMEKIMKKREKEREKEMEREKQLAQEVANAGPLPRDVENEMISKNLPNDLKIKAVAADGNCLYRAVGAQCGKTFEEMRSLCAETLQLNSDEFAPFCEYTDAVPDYDSYVDQVRSSAEWGGHLELRALSIALKRPVMIYRAQSREPLVIQEQGCDTSDPVRLSYHLHYYSLGEHYNQVVPISVEE